MVHVLLIYTTPAGGCGLNCSHLQNEVLPLFLWEKTTPWETSRKSAMVEGWPQILCLCPLMTFGVLFSIATLTAAVTQLWTTASFPYLSGKLKRRLGMLTKYLCWRAMASLEKCFLTKNFFVACSSWTIETNSSSRGTHGAGHWQGGKPESVLLLFLTCSHTIFMQRTTDPTEKACWERHCLAPLWGMKRNIWHHDIFHNMEFFSPSRSFSRWWREMFSAWLSLAYDLCRFSTRLIL